MGTKIYANPHVSMSFWQGHSPREQRYRRTKCHWREDRRSSKHQLNFLSLFLSLSLSLSLSFIAKMFNSTPWKTTMWSNGFKWDERTSVPPLMPHPSHPMASPCRRSWRRHRPGLNAGGKADSSFWQSSLRNHRSSVRCKMCKYHRIIYNYTYIYILYIHIVLYCITVSVNSYSDGICPVHRTYVYYVK